MLNAAYAITLVRMKIYAMTVSCDAKVCIFLHKWYYLYFIIPSCNSFSPRTTLLACTSSENPDYNPRFTTPKLRRYYSEI